MRMIDAKKEIEAKLSSGEPLSFDAMMCAYTAIQEYIENHSKESDVTLKIIIDGEAY